MPAGQAKSGQGAQGASTGSRNSTAKSASASALPLKFVSVDSKPVIPVAVNRAESLSAEELGSNNLPGDQPRGRKRNKQNRANQTKQQAASASSATTSASSAKRTPASSRPVASAPRNVKQAGNKGGSSKEGIRASWASNAAGVNRGAGTFVYSPKGTPAGGSKVKQQATAALHGSNHADFFSSVGTFSPTGHDLGHSMFNLLISLVFIVVAMKLAQSAYTYTRKKKEFTYVPWSSDVKVKDVVVTDCTHPTAPTLTHHKGNRNPAGLRHGDTSTALVLNAISSSYWWGSPAVWRVCQNSGVSSNHFDVDSFLAVWCYINRQAALQHEAVLRHMARIGDFREAFLSPELVAQHGAEDGVHNIRDAFTALKLVCWLNTLEKKLFSAPYASQDDEDRKFEYFLTRFGAVLKDAETAWSDWQDEYKQGGRTTVVTDGGTSWGGAAGGGGGRSGGGGALTLRGPARPSVRLSASQQRIHDGTVVVMTASGSAAPQEGESVSATVQSAWLHWQEEYHQVVGGFDQLAGGHCRVDLYRRVGLAVLCAPEPLHYYSLCSHSIGCDVILCMYEQHRYEVECKYTQFVNVHSRPVWPRLDMAALVTVLNTLETDAPEGTQWVAARFTDSGPLLRLELKDCRLNKAQRYCHPCERTIYSSGIPPATFCALVQSFFEFGLQGLRPKRGGWTWEELHAINSRIPWVDWVACCVSQHNRGELSEGGSIPLSPGGDSMQRRSIADGDEQLVVAERPPRLSEASHILDAEELCAAVGAVPGRYAQGDWRLLYCTSRDGISLHTLYRKAAGKSPTIMIVKDSGGNVFGAYASEPWRIGPRFYGSGETCVFQLRPRRTLYSWRKPKVGHNDFFQFGTHEGLGVGGSGHFAFWLDNDLLEGSSNPCDTFGSPCLASKEDFNLSSLELWEIS